MEEFWEQVQNIKEQTEKAIEELNIRVPFDVLLINFKRSNENETE